MSRGFIVGTDRFPFNEVYEKLISEIEKKI
jgi:hypothetical protein